MGVCVVDLDFSCQTESPSYSQAIMMSICLQSMVDELMVKKSGGSIRKVSSRDLTAEWLCSPGLS